jgi:hypothetical protein
MCLSFLIKKGRCVEQNNHGQYLIAILGATPYGLATRIEQ